MQERDIRKMKEQGADQDRSKHESGRVRVEKRSDCTDHRETRDVAEAVAPDGGNHAPGNQRKADIDPEKSHRSPREFLESQRVYPIEQSGRRAR